MAPGPRVFEVAEVDRLLPELESIFAELDRLREELRALKLRVNALELIWGEAVRDPKNPDHGELSQHLAEMRQAKERFEATGGRVAALGGQVKSVDPALVDFLGVRDGQLVNWCWTRAETRIAHWHHVDEGFANRRPL